MKEVLAYISRIFTSLTPLQKKAGGYALAACLGLVSWIVICHPFSNYTVLFPNQTMGENEKKQMRNYLHLLSIPFKEKGEILVPAKQVERLRIQLQDEGKAEAQKGFELFDTNTWIKGEKELQVLEMRALKGQLEKDLTEFENIKHASVILDLAPSRQFGSQVSKTKASVILTLMPHAHLSASQLRAITYHLAGAVRGLEPHMVAISDTKGRLYQVIDSAEPKVLISDQDLIIEAQIQEKIERLLTTIFGAENFYASAQMGPDKTMEVAAVINKQLVEGTLLEDIAQQMQAIGRGYAITLKTTINSFCFEKQHLPQQEAPKPEYHILGLALFSLLVAITVLAFLALWRYFTCRSKASTDGIHDIMTRVDLHQLADSLKEEDPATLALMLSYLETKRAEEILSAFPTYLQEEILVELEKVS